MRGEPAQPPKRTNRASLTLEQKLEAIRRVTALGDSKASVARDLGVPESTLRGWCKSEDKIVTMIKNARQSSQSSESETAYSPASGSATPSTDDDVASTSQSAPKRRKLERPSRTETEVRAEDAIGHSYNATAASNAAMPPMPSQAGLTYEQFEMTKNLSEEHNSLLSNLVMNNLSLYYSKICNNYSLMQGITNGTTVNFVNNGLQYLKSGNQVSNAVNTVNAVNAVLAQSMNGAYLNGVNAKNNGQCIPIYNTGAAAPHSEAYARSVSRQSVSPAAEPPSTLIPPQQYNDYSAIAQQVNGQAGSRRNNIAAISRSTAKQNIVFSKNVRKAWEENAHSQPAAETSAAKENVWEYLKNYGCPINCQKTQAIPSTSAASPRQERRAALDDILLNMNNSDCRPAEVSQVTLSEQESANETVETIDDAIEYGKKLLNWMTKCSVSNVSQLEVLQFDALIQKLQVSKEQANAPASVKQNRKSLYYN